MDRFPIVRRKDAAPHAGQYCTKKAVLQVYDQLAALGRALDWFASPPDPPRGHERATHGEETRPAWA